MIISNDYCKKIYNEILVSSDDGTHPNDFVHKLHNLCT